MIQSWIREIRARLDRGALGELLKNSSWLLASNGMRTVIAPIRSIVIARGLGVELYGSFVLVVASVSVIIELFNMNLGTAIIRFGAALRLERAEKTFAELIQYLLRVAAGSMLVGLALVASAVFLAPDAMSLPFIVIAVYALGASLAIPESVLSGLLRLLSRFKMLGAIDVGFVITDLVLVLVAVLIWPGNLTVFVCAVGLGMLARFAATSALSRRAWRNERTRRAPEAATNVTELDRRAVWKFVLTISASRTVHVIGTRIDALLAGALLGVQAVAVFDLAKKLAFSVLRLTDPLTNAVYPQLADLVAAGDLAAVRHLLFKSSRLLVMIGLPLIPLGFIGADWLFNTLYGAEFLEGARLFPLILIGASISMWTFWTVPALQALGLEMQRLGILIVGLAVLVASILSFVPMLGLIGLAVAFLVSNSVIVAASVIAVHRRLTAKK